MKPPPPPELGERAQIWGELNRWERAEVGRSLRRLGWTYSEIQELIPVPKGTLSYCCREIELSTRQIEAIRARTRVGIPRNTQRKRREEIERIEQKAREYGRSHLTDQLWVAGTVLYWAEGATSLSKRSLELTNADPVALTLFILWVRAYHNPDARFAMALHLHEGNDEGAAKDYWRAELGLADSRFTKTFIKPRGIGHRKNQLPHGICRVRLDRGTDAWIRTLVWIEVVRESVLRLQTDPRRG